MTNIKKMYLLLKDNPDMTNPELRAALGWSDQLIRSTKYRLKMYGYINYGDGEPLTILRDYKDDSDIFPTSGRFQRTREFYKTFACRKRNQAFNGSVVTKGGDVN